MRTWGVLCASLSLAGCPIGLDAPTAGPRAPDARAGAVDARPSLDADRSDVPLRDDAALTDALDPETHDAAGLDALAGAPDALAGDARDAGPRPDSGCGICRIAQPNGSCALVPGVVCGGMVSCTSVVWGPGSVRDGGVGDEACLAAAGMAPLRCSPAGVCDHIDPDECTAGAPVVTCPDGRCTDPNQCPRGAPSTLGSLDGYCVRATSSGEIQQWPTCPGDYCSDVTKTGVSEEYIAGCDFAGECTTGNFSAFCGDYLCDAATNRCAAACAVRVETCRPPAVCDLATGLCVQ